MKKLSSKSLRRFTAHRPTGRPMILAADHPAVVEGRSLFTKSANTRRIGHHALISGKNSRKIGGQCQKGAWSGMPIFTLTLEERKTCPRSCVQWRSCYGNKMQWSFRLQAGPELEEMLARELSFLNKKYPTGFIVRLHVLGDFYSVEYVNLWRGWLDRFPALRVFGYTARQDEIGEAIRVLTNERWDRFAIRSSDAVMPDMPSSVVIKDASLSGDSIICPAQTEKSDCCSTCALCWQSKKQIAFLEH